MKTYKLIKPIGDYPLEEYTKEWDKYVIAKTLEFEWGGSYKVFHYIPAEIVENMPEYFVEVKEDWIDELIDRILPHIENSLETAEDYQRIREAIEKNMPKQSNIPESFGAGGMMGRGWPPVAIIKYVPCGCGCASSEVCNCKGCTQKTTI